MQADKILKTMLMGGGETDGGEIYACRGNKERDENFLPFSKKKKK